MFVWFSPHTCSALKYKTTHAGEGTGDPWGSLSHLPERLRSSWQLSTFSSFVQANNSLVIHMGTLLQQETWTRLGTSCYFLLHRGQSLAKTLFLSDGVLLLSICILTVASEVVLHAIREAVTWAAMPSMVEATTTTTHPCPTGSRNSRINRPGPLELHISRQEFTTASLQLQ